MTINENIPAYDLGQVKLTMGVVLSCKDPENRGRVKAYVPGLFSTKTMNVDAMPWIWPFKMWGFQSFSLQTANSKIWVIILPNNPYGYFYMPFFELNTNTKAKISGETDVVVSRGTSNGDASIYYNKEDGVISRIGDSKFQITPSLDTYMSSNGSSINIKGGKVTIGKADNTGEPMVLGDKLKTLLNNLSSGLNQVAQQMVSSPYEVASGNKLIQVVQKLNNDISTIQSETCNVTQ